MWTPCYCGHPAKRKDAKSPSKIFYRRSNEKIFPIYGLSLLRTVTHSPVSVCSNRSWLQGELIFGLQSWHSLFHSADPRIWDCDPESRWWLFCYQMLNLNKLRHHDGLLASSDMNPQPGSTPVKQTKHNKTVILSRKNLKQLNDVSFSW